jgi:peptide chain release factor 1
VTVPISLVGRFFIMDLERHLKGLKNRFDQLLTELSAPDVASDPKRFQDLRREHARLSPLMDKYRTYQGLLREEQDLILLVQSSEPEIKKLAEEDLVARRAEKKALEDELQMALLPRDPNEDRNIIMEIRAGAGGDEAGLFAADLLRMYSRYAETHRLKTEVLSSSMSERGGIKEVTMQISGAGVWNQFKFERGVHRVQRVPATEASGRIHTSTATVAVLPEAEDVDVNIDPSDLRIDTFRASGAGGQHINKTDSAVRITHNPSGLVVACQEERSQIKNRAKAMKLLRSRLLQMAQDKHEQEISQNRRSQVGTGDRSEKIRTYNFPQDRVTDHRINVSVHNLPAFMEGDMDGLIAELQKNERADKLSQLAAQLENSR